MSRKVRVERVDLASGLDAEIDRKTEIPVLPAQSLAEIALPKLREVDADDPEHGIPKCVLIATEDLYRNVAGKLER